MGRQRKLDHEHIPEAREEARHVESQYSSAHEAGWKSQLRQGVGVVQGLAQAVEWEEPVRGLRGDAQQAGRDFRRWG